MSLHIPEGSIKNSLRSRHQSLRRALALRLGVRAGAAGAVVIAIAVVIGAIAGLGETGAWARLVILGALCIAVIAWAVGRFGATAPRFDTYLERVETRFPDVRSWLRNAIDFASPRTDAAATGTSRELAEAVTRETVTRLDGLPLATLAPPLAPRRPALAIVAALAIVVIASLFAPRAVQRSWASLWNPAAAAAPVELAVEPGSVRVTPGASLTVFARVTGSDRAPRLIRDGQKPLEGIADGEAGATRVWRFDLAQLTRAQDYQVRVVSASSPKYQITLAGEPVPVSFEVEYRAPSYARLPVQRGSALRGDLTALRGTRARVAVTFDRDLRALAATLPGGIAAEWKPLTARRWEGVVVLEREGEYELHAVASAGEGRFHYRIQPLTDAPPVIAVRTPEGDVDLPNGQQLPLEVIGQDDLGLTELKLEFRKDPSGPWTTTPLARFAGHPREAQVRSRWDASALALLPGETATFRFVLFDDGRNRAESQVFELRFPSLADLYEQIDETQGGVQKTLEKVVDQAKELQKSLDKLARQQPRSQTASPAFERSEELKSNLERQQDLAKQLDQAAEGLRESLEKAGERDAFNDELERKLKEMAELMEQVQSKEFREAMKRMQQAMENLDKQALENQLPNWKQNNKEMLQNLQRTLDLLKKLREEERLESLAKRAEELKAQQDQLNKEHESAENRESQDGKDSKDGKEGKDGKSAEQQAKEAQQRAEEQKKAAEESEQLAQDAKEMAQKMEQQDQQKQLAQTAEELQQQAAEPQKEAANSAEKMQSGQAKRSGQKASQGLQRAAQQMQKLANQRQQQEDGADLAAVRRAAQDLVSLQRESEGNLDPSRPNGERANRQTDLSEGVARVADSLGVIAKNTPFLSPKLSESLGKAMNQLSQSGKDLGSGNRSRGDQLGRDGSTALNEAILELRLSEAAMCKQPGQGQGEQPGMSQRMSSLGQQQSQLNQRSKSIAQRLSEQMRLSAGDRDEMQRMGQEQARLREQLEQIQRDDQSRRELLGRLDATAREMKEVEEALRQGTSSGDLEEKQTRILSRLLDAQRSVNRRDFDPEREARAGTETVLRSAPEIPADMMRESDRLRSDMLKADADRYPAQYRAFIEAYLKSLNEQRR